MRETKTEVTSYRRQGGVLIENLNKPEQHLYQIAGLLDSLNLKWCFAFGSALGLYRDDGFVPRDQDIDIMILADDINIDEVKAVCETQYKLIRVASNNGDIGQLAFQHTNRLIIDLCFYYKHNDNYISWCDSGYWEDPVHVIGNFKKVKTKFGYFPVPEKIEDYLVIRYGDDWLVPKYGIRGISKKKRIK